MNDEEIRALVIRLIEEIAPEVDANAVVPDERLTEQFDLDSLDGMHFIVRLSEETGVDIPESDYARTATLASCIEYLKPRTAAA